MGQSAEQLTGWLELEPVKVADQPRIHLPLRRQPARQAPQAPRRNIAATR
jgi:hypothetical protein